MQKRTQSQSTDTALISASPASLSASVKTSKRLKKLPVYLHFSCQAVPQASVHLLQLLLQHPLTQEGFCTPCTAAEIANNNNNNIIIARFRELRLGENITSCTIKPRQPATPWEQRHPPVPAASERISAYRSVLPGQGLVWQPPRQPPMGIPPAGSADRPSGCSGTCSAGQRSIPRPKGSG